MADTSTNKTEQIAQAIRAMSEPQAACYINMSRSFLRQDRMNGTRTNRTDGPPFVKIGRRIRYLKDDLDAWLEENRVVRNTSEAAQ